MYVTRNATAGQYRYADAAKGLAQLKDPPLTEIHHRCNRSFELLNLNTKTELVSD